MKIRVTMETESIAIVVFTPSLLDRLMGEKVEERIAVKFPSIGRGQNSVWLYDVTGRVVPNIVQRAIDDELVRRDWDRIMGREAK